MMSGICFYLEMIFPGKMLVDKLGGTHIQEKIDWMGKTGDIVAGIMIPKKEKGWIRDDIYGNGNV